MDMVKRPYTIKHHVCYTMIEIHILYMSLGIIQRGKGGGGVIPPWPW